MDELDENLKRIQERYGNDLEAFFRDAIAGYKAPKPMPGMTEQEQLEQIRQHQHHGSFTKSDDTLYSIDYTCVHGTKHTIYSPCIAGLNPPKDCDCSQKPVDTCPRCGAQGIPGYELICCCSPEAIQQITDEHALPLHIRLKPPLNRK